MTDKTALPAHLWFSPDSLRPLVDGATLSRGQLLYRSRQVLSLQISPTSADGIWRLAGQVQGSQRTPYEVSAEIELHASGQLDSWDSWCSCPMDYQCKHGVALALHAAHHGVQQLGQQSRAVLPASHYQATLTPQQRAEAEAANQERMEMVARQQGEAQLVQWLTALAQAQHGSTPPQPRQEQFLYLLSSGQPGQRPELRLEAVTSSPKVHGGWTKPRALRTQPYPGQAVYDQASEADHHALQLLYTMAQRPSMYGFSHFQSDVLLHGPAAQLLLELAVSTGRLRLREAGGQPGPALRWGSARPLHWHWHEVPSPYSRETGWSLQASLHPAGQPNPSPDSVLCHNLPPLYLDRATGECGPVQTNGLSDTQLGVLFKTPPLKPSALQKFQLEVLQQLGPVPLPPCVQTLPILRDITPVAELTLSRTPADLEDTNGLLQAQLRFNYQGQRGWWAGQGNTVQVAGADGPLLLQRDTEAEFDAVSRLMDLGLMAADEGIFGIPSHQPQHTWLHWADNGFSVLREAGFEVHLAPELRHWIAHADTLDVQLQHEGEDPGQSPWFRLSLGMEVNGQRHNILPLLPQLIAAAAAHQSADGAPQLPSHVYLPQGEGFVRLPTDTLRPWMAALLELVGDKAHNFNAEQLKLSRMDALRTSAALGEGVAWQGAQQLHATLLQLGGQAALPEVPLPAGLHATLRPYQQQGLNWLQFLRTSGLGGILADDMGLGKTLQTLAHLLVEKEAGRLDLPALIVAPVSLMGNWRREAARFTPGLRVLVLHGKDRHEVATEMASHDVVIAPYSLLQRDRERWLEQAWHLVVLDEAQNIKNANTHAAQVVSALNTRHRLCLSGTPMENHLGELWSLFHFLMPGFLGSQARFKTLFRTPIEKQADGERAAQLRRRISPFMLRRTKREVATELPDKIETLSSVELQGAQANLYETIRLSTEQAVREALHNKGLAKSQIQILDALLKLRQVCCDPRLLKLDAAQGISQSAKLEHLMELLPALIEEGRRVLLFSQFTGMLTLIEAALKKQGIPWVKLTGQSQKREEIIDKFTSGAVPLFLISLKAGGVGLNLPQADTVIHYDPWWNPAAENQATDRAHRIGQKNQVFVYKLVAQGTIEERILALQERKASLANNLYSGTATRQALFTENDVAELLKPLE